MFERGVSEVDKEIIKKISEEGVEESLIEKNFLEGTLVIPKSNRRNFSGIIGIGKNLRTKVNANLGTSQAQPEISKELEKLEVAIQAGVDTVMDLSTGGNLKETLISILEHSSIPVGTVPIYQTAVEAVEKKGQIVNMDIESMFRVMENQAEEGVDFMTVHCGVTQETIKVLASQGRLTDVVSRGGTIIIEWMFAHNKENPFFEYFDEVLKIAKKYGVTLSLGDGLRPGCIADATDRPQIQELLILGELVERAREVGVQVIVEGPGHVPLDQIQANVLLEKKLCKGAPFYVLGPLVTDIAPGYDHITSAIGGAIAGAAGADFLCYVTRSEHLRLPTADDVREGVIAARIAAHAADIAKGVRSAWIWDEEISKARKKRDWKRQFELGIDPEIARKIHNDSPEVDEDVCSMCSWLCSMKKMEEIMAIMGEKSLSRK